MKIKIKIKKKCWSKKYNSYRLGLDYDDKKIWGFNDFVPYVNDVIECDLQVSKINNFDIEFINPIFYPPTSKYEQKTRIIELLQENNLDITLIEEFKNFSYDSNNFWFDICNYYYSHNNLEGYEIKYCIKIVFNHISNYLNILLVPFKIALNNLNIKLNNNQLLILLQKKINIDNIHKWTYDDLLELFNEKGFNINSILNIAFGLKFNLDDITKLIIYYKLNYDNSSDGSTIIKYEYNIWINDIKKFIKDNKLDYNIIENLTEKKFIEIIDNNNDIIKIDNYLIGKYIYDKEFKIAEYLVNIKNINIHLSNNINTIKQYLNTIEIDTFSLDDEQKNSVINLFENNISITFGQAGTGKSSIIKTIIETLENNIITKYTDIKLFFLTPTAKAKHRINEIIINIRDNIEDYNCYTIHSFNANAKNHNIEYGETNIFIIDESSMIDIHLLYDFLNLIIKHNVKIMFLGDSNQLPSIDKGNILNDMINSNIIISTELKNTYRYNNLTHLKDILNIILTKEKLTNNILNINKNEFKFININNKKTIEKIIEKRCKKNDILISPKNDYILKYTPIISNKLNPLNINNINIKNFIKIINDNNFLINKLSLRYKIKDKTENNIIIINNNIIITFYNEIEYNKYIFRINDKIIHTKNFNDENLFNGLTGSIIIIFEIDNIKYIVIKRDDNNKYYMYNCQKKYIKYLNPAYMITIHKSQGSEYNNVMILLHEDNYILNTNNLLYTAFSRAKKRVTIVSNLDILNKTINKKFERKTLLSYMLKYNNNNNNNNNLENLNNFIEFFTKIIK